MKIHTYINVLWKRSKWTLQRWKKIWSRAEQSGLLCLLHLLLIVAGDNTAFFLSAKIILHHKHQPLLLLGAGTGTWRHLDFFEGYAKVTKLPSGSFLKTVTHLFDPGFKVGIIECKEEAEVDVLALQSIFLMFVIVGSSTRMSLKVERSSSLQTIARAIILWALNRCIFLLLTSIWSKYALCITYEFLCMVTIIWMNKGIRFLWNHTFGW